MNNIMMSADEVSNALKVSKSKAYKVIAECNQQLKKDGYLVLAGRVPRAYLMTRIYGGDNES